MTKHSCLLVIGPLCVYIVYSNILSETRFNLMLGLRLHLHNVADTKNYNKSKNKKALLSQRRPRDAPNIWVPGKVSRVLANTPGYFSRNL